MIDTSKWKSIEISPNVWLLMGADGYETGNTGVPAKSGNDLRLSQHQRERLSAILQEIAARARAPVAASATRSDTRPGDLTARQSQIARMVREGASNKDIARSLGLSVGTVKVHLHRIYKLLGVSSRVELAIRKAGPSGGG